AAAAACPSSPRSRRPTSCAKSWATSAFRPTRPRLCRPAPSLAAQSLPRHRGLTRRLARPRPGCAQTPTTTVSRGRPPSPQAEDFLDHRFVRLVYGLLSASCMGSGEERRDREEGGAGWRGPCQHKVEVSAPAPSRDVRFTRVTGRGL